MPGSATHLRASLLDRLVDPDSDRGGDENGSHDIAELTVSVRRDLASLLSTRHHVPLGQSEARGYPVWAYGIQDFAHLSPRSEADREQVAAAILEAIERFEPRLERVRVAVTQGSDVVETLRIEITALLVADEARRPISFPFILRR